MMTEKPWWQNAAVYEIYIRSFQDSNGDGIGDLNGIRSRLGYIRHLGVDAIWISPFFSSPCIDNGYDIADYYNVDPQYGTKADFLALLEEAHALGLRVILDMVLNHTSSQHPWFIESRSSVDSPMRNRYIWRRDINNWGAQFGGSAWHYDEKTREYYLGLFCADQPDLNWKNADVRRDLKNMMCYWADLGVDGFRLDSISLIAKPDAIANGALKRGEYSDFHDDTANLPMVHEYLKELYTDVFEPYSLFTIGEAASVTPDDAVSYCLPEHNELNVVLWFDHMALDGSEVYKWTGQGVDTTALKRVLLMWQHCTEGRVCNTLFWCNHDQPRIISKIEGAEQYRERAAKMLCTGLYLLPGTMFLYQGQELAMEGGVFVSKEDLRDVEAIHGYDALAASGIPPEKAIATVGKKTRDNARTPMQWSAGLNCGFSSVHPWINAGKNYSTVNVEEQSGRADSVLNYYRRIIQYRKNEPCLSKGSFAEVESPEGVLAYLRLWEERSLLVVCNMKDSNQPFSLPDTFRNSRLILSNICEDSSGLSDNLRPFECYVLLSDNKSDPKGCCL